MKLKDFLLISTFEPEVYIGINVEIDKHSHKMRFFKTKNEKISEKKLLTTLDMEKYEDMLIESFYFDKNSLIITLKDCN